MGKMYASLQERLIQNSAQRESKYIDPRLPDEQRLCCIWCGLKIRNDTQGYGEEFVGYGRIGLHNPATNSTIKRSTHKVAFAIHSMLSIGIVFDSSNPDHMKMLLEILEAYKYLYYSEGLTHDHICVDSRCWNPYHLRWMTIQRNLMFRDKRAAETEVAEPQDEPKRKRKPAKKIRMKISNESRRAIVHLVSLARAESENCG